MRHARSPFSLYRRQEVWWVQFRIHGQRTRESTGESDRGRAEERAAARWQEAKARAGDPVGPGTIRRSLAAIAAELVAEARGAGRADTYARDLEVDLRLHILTRWNTPEAITSLGWEQARVDIHAEGQSWASVRRIGKHLRMLLRFCVRKGALVNEPVIHSPAQELVTREAAEHEALSRRDRDRLLADMKERGNLRALRCYELMFFNLFRRSTVARLLPSWVDLKARTVRVPASGAKNSKARVYWLHLRALRAIREQMRENASTSAPIFGRFDHSNVFWSAVERLGIATQQNKRGLTPHHVTRRTAATMLVEAGVTTKDRMAAGGWESVEAAERYDLPGEQLERSRRALRKLR